MEKQKKDGLLVDLGKCGNTLGLQLNQVIYEQFRARLVEAHPRFVY